MKRKPLSEKTIRARMDFKTVVMSLTGFVEAGKEYRVQRRGRTITITPVKEKQVNELGEDLTEG